MPRLSLGEAEGTSLPCSDPMLRRAWVVDPTNRLDAVREIAIGDGEIRRVQRSSETSIRATPPR